MLHDVQLSIQLILCFDFVDILHLLDDPILIFRLYHKLVIRLMIQLIDYRLLSYAFCTVGWRNIFRAQYSNILNILKLHTPVEWEKWQFLCKKNLFTWQNAHRTFWCFQCIHDACYFVFFIALVWNITMWIFSMLPKLVFIRMDNGRTKSTNS